MNLSEDGQRDAPAVVSRQSVSFDDDFDNAVAAGAGAGGSKPPIKRRAPIACKRCRRMRSKCIHDKATPPCKACGEAGLTADDCIFPVRGQPDNDREYRHPRVRRTDKVIKRDPARARQDILDLPVASRPPPAVPRPKHTDEWDLLPPLPDIIEAVRLFTRNYFQLGFIPKDQFRQQLASNHRSVSVFLLLGILSISARFSSSLASRYDGEIKAAAFFMERANAIALQELYQEPTLERCQAFYLLSLAQQGSGMRNMSYMNLGIATRMAVLMHLHREEFYKVTTPTAESTIRLESARRTLWMLHSQDNLHSGAMSPISLAASDITCLLPSNETDFALGRVPAARAALEDTPPARENPSLIHQSSRSLFASLIQAHYYWGRVARRAIVSDKSSKPWDPNSDYSIMAEKLANWENRLPQDHRWSMVLLKGHKSVGEDLAYMNVTMVTKLCNVVLRRPYLDQMISPNSTDPSRRAFFSRMSDELFRNVRDLYEQIDAQYATRESDESVGAQMASFCVYSCGLFSTYLCKYKNICSDRSIMQQGPNMLQRCMTILIESKEIWPLASRWLESLERYSRDPKAAAVSLDRGMADGDDRTLRPLHVPFSPSFASKGGQRGQPPLPLKLPGPSSPEDSKANVFLATSTASPTAAQNINGLQQAHNGTHALAPQASPAPSEQQLPAPQPVPVNQPMSSYTNDALHHGLPHHQQPPPHPQPPSHVPTQHFTYTPHRLEQLHQHVYAQHQHQQQHHQHQHHQHHQQQHTYVPHNPMNTLAQAAFEQPAYQTAHMAQAQMVSPQTPHPSHMYQLPQLQQPSQAAVYEGPPQPGFFTPPTPTAALGPGNDGYEVELQSWFDDTAQSNGWVGNGVGIGYPI